MNVKKYTYRYANDGELYRHEELDGEFVLSSDYAELEARHNALKEAAKGLLAIHKRHKCLTVYSEQDYRDIWSERVGALAALVGEE